MSRKFRNALLVRVLGTLLLLVGHSVLMEALDRRDVVGRALALHETSISPLAVLLATFLALRVFVYVVLPGFVLFWVVDALVEFRRRRSRD